MDDADLGSRIRRAREDRGVGLRELAGRLRIAHSALSKIETGTRAVRGTELVAIAAELGMSVDELLLEGGSPSAAVARAVAAEAGESASAALANWLYAADRAAALSAAEVGGEGMPQEWLVAAAEAYLPQTRDVGVPPERTEMASELLIELVRRVVIRPLPRTVGG
jgi:transcriptional regulator with XRE-family HTH domain